MSAKSHKTDIAILTVLGLVALAVILLIVGFGYVGRGGNSGPAVPSSYSRNRRGAAVGYELFRRLGYPVVRHEAPLFEDKLKSYEAMFVLSPLYPLEEGEADGLRNWIRRGGLLVCTSDVYLRLWGEEDGLQWYEIDPYSAHSGFGENEHEMRSSYRPHPTIIPPLYQDLALSKDVSRICLATGSTLENIWDDSADESPDDAPPPEKGTEEFAPLLQDEKGLRIAESSRGMGRIIVIADTSFLANNWVGRSDNSILAANMVHYIHSATRGRRMGFDEYHFGFGGRPTGVGTLHAMLFQTGPGWALLTLSAAGIAFLFYKGRRFGVRRAPGRPRRRSKLEYVYAVGATYRAVRANRLTFGIVYRWFKRRMAIRFAMAPNAASEEIAAAAERYVGIHDRRYRRLLAECEDVLIGAKRVDLSRAGLRRDLERMEREVSDGHPTR